MRHARPIAAVTLCCCAFGCTSSYVPRPSPRLSLIMEGGTYAYVRDGKKYEGGVLGGDLEEAVRGDPTAEEYASQFRTGMTAGLVLTTVGALGVVGGLVLTGADASQTTPGHPLPPTGPVVCGVGLVTELVGVIVGLNAAPHLFDAINAYNDALGSRAEAPPTPGPSPAR
jgi:hypothetical protein